MPNTFEILTGFLSRYGDEVEGRESVVLPTEVKAKISDFARGKLPPPEQAELIGQLNDHPDWVVALAVEVKALRGTDSTNP